MRANDIITTMAEVAGQVVVRLARDDDDLDLLNVGNTGWFSAASIRGIFASVPAEIPTAIWVAEIDGRPAGYAHAAAAGIRDGHRALAEIYVRPDNRRRGLGGALWREVLALCTPDRVSGIMLGLDAADDGSRRVAEAYGLHPAGVHLESTLDLTAPPAVTPTPPGVVLGEVPDDDAHWRALWTAANELSAQTPDAAEGSDNMPYEVFRTFVAEPWHTLCAWRGDDIVGLTFVAVRDVGQRSLNTMLTGVVTADRGQGLATALKSAHAQRLSELGWRNLVTQNMEQNAPILAANRRLGFSVTGGQIDYTYDHPA